MSSEGRKYFDDERDSELKYLFNMYDLIIIGGGPAGVSAGVYASRKQLKSLFITSDWGGQSIVSPDIQKITKYSNNR